MLVGNDFIATDIAAFDVAQAILKVNQIAYCQPLKLEKRYQNFLVKFAEDMCARINTTKIQAHIKKFRQDQCVDVVCNVLTNLLNTWSVVNYYSSNANEATLVRDITDTFLKAYFSSSALTKSLCADFMIKDSVKRFLRLNSSLITSGKRTDFSGVPTKCNKTK